MTGEFETLVPYGGTRALYICRTIAHYEVMEVLMFFLGMLSVCISKKHSGDIPQ
jgi:hypothetical protein